MPQVREPNDIDSILVMPPDWDWSRKEFRPFEYGVIDKKSAKRQYKIEVFVVESGSDKEREFLDLFGKIREEWCDLFGWPKDDRKGIVRLIK